MEYCKEGVCHQVISGVGGVQAIVTAKNSASSAVVCTGRYIPSRE
jgi:hypothetical protein